MSSTNGKPRGRQPYMSGKSSAPIDHDGEATWPRAAAKRMDEKFRHRMRLAIERGLERLPDDEPVRAA